MSERYEIATFFDVTCGGNGVPHIHHKVTIDNYGQGKYMSNHIDASHMVKEEKPYTKPLSPCLIRFIQAANRSVGATNSHTWDGQVKFNYSFIKDLYLLQDVQKEIEEEVEKQVKEKVAEFEAEYRRRIQMYKDDFQAEIDEARKILQEHKQVLPLSPILVKKCSLGLGCGGEGDATMIPGCSCGVSTICKLCNLDADHIASCALKDEKNLVRPVIEHIQTPLSVKKKCIKCKVHPIFITIKNCSCAFKDCCSVCLKGQRHASHCSLFCNGKVWID